MKQHSRSGFLEMLTGIPPSNSTSENGLLLTEPEGPSANTETPDLTPYKGTMGQEQLLHLLRRSLFGVTQADYRFFSGKPLKECLDILLTQAHAPEPPVNVYNTPEITDPQIEFGKTWVYAAFGDDDFMLNGLRLSNLKRWWVGQMINQDRSLTEKMTLFWSNFMAVQMLMIKDSRLSYSYLRAIRASALGNYKALVREMTTNPGMLQYLNGNDNTVKAPNENFSRELQELFTVGKEPGEHFNETDVREAARVLTGWDTTDTWDSGKPGGVGFTFVPERHDQADKQFSAFYGNKVIKGKPGEQGAHETDELIDMIFTKREVARFCCKNIYRWFVSSNITPSIEANIITPLEDIFIENKFEIKPVLRALLGSNHFFDPLNMSRQIKSPIDLFIGACRQLCFTTNPSEVKRPYDDWSYIANRLQMNRCGMDPGDPPGVAGWLAYYQAPVYGEIWINSATLIERNQVTDFIFNDQFDVLSFASQLPNPSDPNKLVADSCKFLSAVPFTAEQTTIMKNILLSGQMQDHYWTEAWKDYTSAPTNPAAKSVVLTRLKDLYNYILQRSEYQLT